jgi:Di-haem oxidoreductase, putative peroxidase
VPIAATSAISNNAAQAGVTVDVTGRASEDVRGRGGDSLPGRAAMLNMLHGTSIGSTAWLLVTLAVTVGGLGSVLTSVDAPIVEPRQGRGAASRDQDRRTRFSHDGFLDDERGTGRQGNPAEAATGFDDLTNGFDPQGSAFDALIADSVVALRSFNDNRFIFEEVELTADGLGPTYNAQSCRECHQNVVTGGASQVTEQRSGHLSGGAFFESLGGSLIQSRATHPDAVELVAFEDDIRTFRISTNTLGAGYVEAIANDTLAAIRDGQPAALRGSTVVVPVLESNGRGRLGRFGWKSQHASLESFAADAYLNEMGVTSPLLPFENTVSGADAAAYDPVTDPEDDGEDIRAFANFIRSTKAPARGAITPPVQAGEQVFSKTGCVTCHVASITTAPEGTVVNGGALVVRAALANKVIHPYSDFLLHDVGTGDGIPIQPTPEYASTANQIRTAPLWGLRTRNRLMHDGLSFTREEAILRHAGQAKTVIDRYSALTAEEKAALLAFLNSL